MKFLFNSKQIFAYFLFCLGMNTLLPAQNWNQIIKSVASDRAQFDKFGKSIAISGDYAIVGAPYESENATGGATLPSSGSAYIFKRTGTTWVQEAKIVAADRAAGDNFGFSVAISGDYAIVGADEEDENTTGGATMANAGAAYVFRRTGTAWVQEAKIVANDRTAFRRFGEFVTISGDYAIVGAPYEDKNAIGSAIMTNAGAAYIFKRMGTTWAQEAKIVASDRTEYNFFGSSVAISGDYAIIGAIGDSKDTTGTWRQTLSQAGAAYIFKRTETAWIQEAKIITSNRAAGDRFGHSVAISGNHVIVGVPYEDENTIGIATMTNVGAAYIFKRTGTTWREEAKIVASDRMGHDSFGGSVSISGDYAIVGASGQSNDATGSTTMPHAGAAYIFKRTGTTWAQEARIVASDRTEYNFFGSSVAISGNYAIVGVPIESEDAIGGVPLSSAGAVYFYQRTAALNTVQIDKGNSLKVYPNPVSDILTLEAGTAGNYHIFNLLGQTVLSGQVNTQIQNIDVSALPVGTYILSVGAENIKFLKQ